MIIVITGPTGVGKTKLSVELAKKVNQTNSTNNTNETNEVNLTKRRLGKLLNAVLYLSLNLVQ